MIIEIFYAFLVRIIKLFHRNFIATIFVSILVVLVRRKYKLSDIKNELNFIWNDIKKKHRYRNCIYRPDRAHCTAFQCMASADTVHAFRSSVHDDYSGIGIPASVNRASSSSTLSSR